MSRYFEHELYNGPAVGAGYILAEGDSQSSNKEAKLGAQMRVTLQSSQPIRLTILMYFKNTWASMEWILSI